jgi:hypothetical protein
MDTWIDILTDPHHLLADFLMNVGFEIVLEPTHFELT